MSDPLEVRRLVSEVVVPRLVADDAANRGRVEQELEDSARREAEIRGFHLGELVSESHEIAESNTPKAGEVVRIKRTYSASRWIVGA